MSLEARAILAGGRAGDIKHASGYHLRYPDYRTGYRALLDQLATT